MTTTKTPFAAPTGAAAVVPPPPPQADASATPRSGIVDDVAPMTFEPYESKRSSLNNLPKVPFELFLAVVIGVILLGVVTVINRTTRNEAVADRDIAEENLAVAESAATEMATVNADLVETNSELATELSTSETERSTLETDLETARQSVADAEAAAAAAEARPVETIVEVADTSELDDRIDELETTNAELLERATTAEEVVAALEEAPLAPQFAQFLGESLASQDGLKIDSEQSSCLGAAIIADIGLAAVGAGLNSDRTTETNGVLVDSMVAAVESCGIDAQDVFGN